MDELELAFGRIYPLYYGAEGQRDRRKAVAALRPLAERGFSPAVYYLGMAYFDGTGVRKNLDEAIRLFRTAAEAGLPAAQGMMGAVYGSAYPKYPCGLDMAESNRWFELAMRSGGGTAGYNLAVRYAQGGLGLEKNPVKALALASLAAERSPIPSSAAEGLRRQLKGQLSEEERARADDLLATLEKEIPETEDLLFYWRRCAQATGYQEPPAIARPRK